MNPKLPNIFTINIRSFRKSISGQLENLKKKESIYLITKNRKVSGVVISPKLLSDLVSAEKDYRKEFLSVFSRSLAKKKGLQKKEMLRGIIRMVRNTTSLRDNKQLAKVVDSVENVLLTTLEENEYLYENQFEFLVNTIRTALRRVEVPAYGARSEKKVSKNSLFEAKLFGERQKAVDGEEDKFFITDVVPFMSPEHGIISAESPFGKAVLGRKVGEVATIRAPMGVYKCKILRIL